MWKLVVWLCLAVPPGEPGRDFCATDPRVEGEVYETELQCWTAFKTMAGNLPAPMYGKGRCIDMRRGNANPAK